MILAVTGTIGSGKSTVCRMLEDMGVPVLDADRMSHTLLEDEEIKKQISEIFGNVFDSDGKTDRKLLAGKVFADRQQLQKLNSVIHPPLKKELAQKAKELEKKHRVVACEVPLLYEAGFENIADKVLVVWVSEQESIKRLISRGMTEKEAVLRINSQMPTEKKLKKADFSIFNEITFEKLVFKVAEILNKC